MRRVRTQNMASRALLGASRRMSAGNGVMVIILGLLGGWVATWVVGGSSTIPPHYFYVPILLAGIRFGPPGALVTAIASGLLAGPLVYADVASTTPQPVSDWGSRMLFFIVIGQILTGISNLSASVVADELEDLRLARALWGALDRGEFEVYFQPIVSIRDHERVVGTEALIRWNDPDRGLVCPDEFVPTAEATGTIAAIDSWVLWEACASAVGWLRDGLVDSDFKVSVNASAIELDKQNYPERVASVLTGTGLSPGQLHIEITETAVVGDTRRFLDNLYSLRRLGVKLALDDFGTGQSTLSQVQSLPLDVIKIDKSFVETVGLGTDGNAIVENVVSLARSLHVSTVAEGVETVAQADLLASLGCDHAQGYLFGRPVPADEFRASLQARAWIADGQRELR